MPGPADPEDLSVEAILIALESLSDQDREVLLLFVGEGLSAVQAGTALGCTEVTARSRLFRARARLAEVLGLDATQRTSTNGHVDGVLNVKGAIEVRSLADE